MTNLTVSLLLFLSILAFIVFIHKKYVKLGIYNFILYLFLFSEWLIMYTFKNNDGLSSYGFLSDHWWMWPIILSLYQFTQVMVRIPFGMLSRKLNSRKQIILIVMMLMLFSLILIIASDFSVWSIVIASIAAGALGSTGGLDAQYLSENWDLKRGFVSTGIIFTIPVSASLFSQIFFETFSQANVDFWMALSGLIFGTISLIAFGVFFKEKKETLKNDLPLKGKEYFSSKEYKHVAILSISTAIVVAAYVFALSFSTVFIWDKWLFNIINFSSLIGSIILSLFIFNIFPHPKFLKLTKIVVLIIIIIGSILIATGNMNQGGWMAIMIVISLLFGAFLATRFGTALHIDHKNETFSLGIFLTIKSFAIGLSALAGNLTVHVINLNNHSLGLIIGLVTIILFIIGEVITIFAFWKTKEDNVNGMVLSSIKYEQNSSKLVNSKNIVSN